MLKINKINLKVISNETELGNSRLELKISGSNINYIIINTIRRVIMTDIPIYSFGEFKFEKNSSIFHNNYLKLRLKHMPVWSIENDVEYFEKPKINVIDTIIEDNENDGDKVELDVGKNINLSTLKQLTMYVNVKNKSNNIISVTTNDAKFYYEEKQISSPYKTPIPLVKLQPQQEIAFSAITKLGTEEENTMYSPVCICAFKQINDNEFDFIIESRGQISEKRIIQVALINIERKIKNFLKLLKDNQTNNQTDNSNSSNFDKEKDLKGLIVVNNEDHTLGNLISRGMQLHNDIKFAGYNLPHPLGKKVNFHYKLAKKEDIKKIIHDVVEYYSSLFLQIKKLVDLI